MKSRVYLTGLFFVICLAAEAIAFAGSENCEVSKGWSAMQTTKENSSKATYDLQTNEIGLGKPFSFAVKICGDEDITPERVTANAIMPAHQHGMNYTPTVEFDKDSNTYKVSDFLFHMPGVWEITVSSYQGEAVTHFTKNITIN